MSFWSEVFGGMSGQEVYENFAYGRGPDGLLEGSTILAKIQTYYSRREEQITEIAGSMEEGWTGDAGGAARRGAGPLAVAHGGAAQELSTAKDALVTQSTDFYRAKAAVDPVPEPPDKPSTFKNVITLGGAQSNYEDKVHESNEVSRKNIVAMDDWTTASGYNGKIMPTDFGDLDHNAFNITIDDGKTPPPPNWPPIPPPVKKPDENDDDNTGGGGKDKNVTGTGKPGTGKTGTGKTGDDGKPGEIKPPGSDDKNGEQTNPERTKTIPKPPPTQWPGDDGKLPGRTSGGDDEGGIGTWPPGRGGSEFGGGTGKVGTGIGTGSGSGSSSGSAGGRLTGGGASGAGGGSSTGASDRLGAGRGSGAGAMGPGEPGARGGAGARGAGGRGGGQGMGGMGQGGRGASEEDEEHQRKYVLEDDAHFQLTDEDGEKYVDPRTGMSPVTPVIGE